MAVTEKRDCGGTARCLAGRDCGDVATAAVMAAGAACDFLRKEADGDGR